MNGNLAYQEEWREELIDGQIVMMSPASTNHTLVSGNIYGIFWQYLKGKKCTPISDGTVVFLTDKDRFVPDFMVVCDPDKIQPDGIHGAPDLVVEVQSPSTARNDRTRKMEVYARCGVREYWIVSPNDRFVEVYRRDEAGLNLHNLYALYPDWELAQMTEEKRAAVETHFKCSLFEDLEISLADVFYRTV